MLMLQFIFECFFFTQISSCPTHTHSYTKIQAFPLSQSLSPSLTYCPSPFLSFSLSLFFTHTHTHRWTHTKVLLSLLIPTHWLSSLGGWSVHHVYRMSAGWVMGWPHLHQHFCPPLQIRKEKKQYIFSTFHPCFRTQKMVNASKANVP